MDAVITYVNGADPLWLEARAKRGGADCSGMDYRFRDWGTLKYLLRGIERYMPFVSNVFLVVADTPGQIPEWASARLKTVRHRDIIPAGLLPTFNSCTIEMFLHRIEGLDERFIYFNDDMFPVGPCSPDDFFEKGGIVTGFSPHLLAANLYKRQCRVSSEMARRAAGRPPAPWFIRPQHTCSPMLKSVSEEVFGLCSDRIIPLLTPFRSACNPNQYLFLDYLYFTGRARRRRMSSRMLSTALHSASSLSEDIRQPSSKIVCINDVNMEEAVFLEKRDAVLAAFEAILPEKSRFEK